MKTPMGWIIAAMLALALAAPAEAWNRNPATTFATLPSDATPPEGITVDASGNVYVSTFGWPESGESTVPGKIITFSPQGKFIREVTVHPDASPHLIGLAFHPTTGALLVLDIGTGNVLQVNPDGSDTVCSAIGAGAGVNALTFDSAGNIYVSDSFAGTIWKIAACGQAPTAWITSPLLQTSGKPPFGANGLAFNTNGTALFVANTGEDSVVMIPVLAGGVAGTPEVLAYSINGADGLIIDKSDNIWVAANQSDEIVVLDPTGKVIAKLGDFSGIDNQGAVRGLLFPASLVFNGNFVLVTNLVLDTRLFGFPTVDSQWAAQVTQYTVSKINANLAPSTHGGGRGR
jgi:sugar lactone lactonase YvrE